MIEQLVHQQATTEHLPPWAFDATGYQPKALLSRRAADAYMRAFSDADLSQLSADGVEFWFDSVGIDGVGREARTVAAWGRVPEQVAARDATRQRGYPMSRRWADAGYERGHLVARAAGGGLDVNLFAQAWQVNQGRSAEGKEFRRLERLAAANTGALVMTRLIYTDDTAVPTFVHLLVAVVGQSVQQGLFTNTPEQRPPVHLDRLRAGTAFHQTVQQGSWRVCWEPTPSPSG